ncbi:MAG: hypothetical protein QM759_04745 [Terricaulis sp.]
MLWLSWFAAFLQVAAEFEPISKLAYQLAHSRLAWIERLILSIVIIRVAPKVRRVIRRKGMPEHRQIRTAFIRAVMGSRIRRMLRSKDLHRRIAALRHNIDDLIALVLKRLPCGLTRRRPILPRPESSCTSQDDACCAPALCADTS